MYDLISASSVSLISGLFEFSYFIFLYQILLIIIKQAASMLIATKRKKSGRMGPS
jgi:hypothetical protein